MSKFKVGDVVYAKEGEYTNYPAGSNYNIPRHGMIVKECGEGYIELLYSDGSITPPLCPDSFSLSPPYASPIRTVTRKEIVAGVYGKVEIAYCASQRSVAIMIAMDWYGGNGREKGHAIMDATELREAAHTLNQIAEALESNGASV